MIDASKFPKAAQLQLLGEEKRARARALGDAKQREIEEAARMSIKPRNKRQQAECKAAEAKVAKRRQKK